MAVALRRKDAEGCEGEEIDRGQVDLLRSIQTKKPREGILKGAVNKVAGLVG